MGRDPFHQPRVVQAPSNLALNISREMGKNCRIPPVQVKVHVELGS